jgi:Mg2+/citrate symporter
LFLALGLFMLLAVLFVLLLGSFSAIPALLLLVPLAVAALAHFGVRSVVALSRAAARQPGPAR